MTPGDDYELVLTPPAIRALQSTLPEAVAAAVIEFMTGPLVENPRRVGKMLRRGAPRPGGGTASRRPAMEIWLPNTPPYLDVTES